jgi:AraC family transcriptional regulator, transcriptional activator FtrA
MSTVATLIYDSVDPLELGIATEVFAVERPELGVPWYRFLLCAAEPGPIRTLAGLLITAPYGLADVAEADILIVPGLRPIMEPAPPALLEVLRQAYHRGARILSFCSGTFLLADAGLLDGRRVTTHWRWAAELAARYPKVQVDPRILFIDDGQILTSAGTAGANDLSLHIVRQDYGATIAAAVARRLVLPPQRSGGQAQYIETPLVLADEADPFGTTVTWMATHLHDDLTVEQMAARAIMSPRTFARRFRTTFGASPYRWLLQQRIALAQHLLETTDVSIERIARCCGFHAAATLRVHFRRFLRVSPQDYRTSFHTASTDSPGQPSDMCVSLPQRLRDALVKSPDSAQ